MTPAVYERRMQFVAGPQTHVFHACEAHRADLEHGDVSCFFPLRDEPVRPHVIEDDADCWFCREGGQ